MRSHTTCQHLLAGWYGVAAWHSYTMGGMAGWMDGQQCYRYSRGRKAVCSFSQHQDMLRLSIVGVCFFLAWCVCFLACMNCMSAWMMLAVRTLLRCWMRLCVTTIVDNTAIAQYIYNIIIIVYSIIRIERSFLHIYVVASMNVRAGVCTTWI